MICVCSYSSETTTKRTCYKRDSEGIGLPYNDRGLLFTVWAFLCPYSCFLLSFVVTKEGKRKRVWGSTAIRNSGVGTREWVTLGVRVEKKGGK